ncbi:MAG: phosphoadenylyl-sulfate reductase [Rhizobiaceae bacterium]
MAALKKQLDPAAEAHALADAFNQRFAGASAQDVIGFAVNEGFAGSVGAVSSFGAESAVLLHLIASVDPSTPVMFLETGKHFGETLDYRNELIAAFGLTGVRNIEPLAETLARDDPDGELHKVSTDRCCAIRKVEPMARAVIPFDAWFTGRKRFQASTRAVLPLFEAVGQRIRINPLAGWSEDDLADYQEKHALPVHPLVAYGYFSIGCAPCTEPSSPDDPRGGRWKGLGKIECGIHLGGLDASLTDSSL